MPFRCPCTRRSLSALSVTSSRPRQDGAARISVHLQAAVDVADERQRGPERHAAQHQREDERREQRVPEELGALHGAAHGRPVPVVEHGVDEDEEAGGAGAQYAAPPPPVVLARQEEVGERHGDAGAHREQDGVDAQQDAVEGVVLPAPDGGEDVVQLHGDGTEGERRTLPTLTPGFVTSLRFI